MEKIDKSEIFISVIQLHKGIVFKVANAYCKNIEDRKDLIQEIIIQLWKSFGNYNNSFKHSTWMYRIALNVAISFYRKENTRKKIENLVTERINSFSMDDDLDEKETDL